jgi:hypothetical protein
VVIKFKLDGTIVTAAASSTMDEHTRHLSTIVSFFNLDDNNQNFQPPPKKEASSRPKQAAKVTSSPQRTAARPKAFSDEF